MTTDEEARKLFDEAARLVEGEILLHERQRMAAPNWFLQRRLKRALGLFERVLALKPESWNSMWLVAKVHQRLGKPEEAFSWLERAYQINPSQVDVAREASLIAMDLGRKEAGVVYAHRATQIQKDDSGLMANLALAYLLANQLPQARASITRSLELDANDEISKTIETIIAHFEREKKTPPAKTEDLMKYWAALSKKK
ncbi:MAG TPA: CDC27 family protein [Verrucomicrobiae bacterium]